MGDNDIVRAVLRAAEDGIDIRSRKRLGHYVQMMLSPFAWVSYADRGQRERRAAFASAASEAAERFSERERLALTSTGTLPTWFWEWVDQRSKYWMELTRNM